MRDERFIDVRSRDGHLWLHSDGWPVVELIAELPHCSLDLRHDLGSVGFVVAPFFGARVAGDNDRASLPPQPSGRSLQLIRPQTQETASWGKPPMWVQVSAAASRPASRHACSGQTLRWASRKAAMKVSPAPVVSTTATGETPVSAEIVPSDAMLPNAPQVTTTRLAPRSSVSRIRTWARSRDGPAERNAIDSPSALRCSSEAFTVRSWETLTPSATSARFRAPPSSIHPRWTCRRDRRRSTSAGTGRYPRQTPKSSETRMRSPMGSEAISVTAV